VDRAVGCRIGFERADVYGRGAVAIAVAEANEWLAALIGSQRVALRVFGEGIAAGVDRGAAGKQGVGERRAAVIDKGAELRVQRRGHSAHLVSVDAVGQPGAAGADANQIVRTGGVEWAVDIVHRSRGTGRVRATIVLRNVMVPEAT